MSRPVAILYAIWSAAIHRRLERRNSFRRSRESRSNVILLRPLRANELARPRRRFIAALQIVGLETPAQRFSNAYHTFRFRLGEMPTLREQ